MNLNSGFRLVKTEDIVCGVDMAKQYKNAHCSAFCYVLRNDKAPELVESWILMQVDFMNATHGEEWIRKSMQDGSLLMAPLKDTMAVRGKI